MVVYMLNNLLCFFNKWIFRHGYRSHGHFNPGIDFPTREVAQRFVTSGVLCLAVVLLRSAVFKLSDVYFY